MPYYADLDTPFRHLAVSTLGYSQCIQGQRSAKAQILLSSVSEAVQVRKFF